MVSCSSTSDACGGMVGTLLRYTQTCARGASRLPRRFRRRPVSRHQHPIDYLDIVYLVKPVVRNKQHCTGTVHA